MVLGSIPNGGMFKVPLTFSIMFDDVGASIAQVTQNPFSLNQQYLTFEQPVERSPLKFRVSASFLLSRDYAGCLSLFSREITTLNTQN